MRYLTEALEGFTPVKAGSPIALNAVFKEAGFPLVINMSHPPITTSKNGRDPRLTAYIHKGGAYNRFHFRKAEIIFKMDSKRKWRVIEVKIDNLLNEE